MVGASGEVVIGSACGGDAGVSGDVRVLSGDSNAGSSGAVSLLSGEGVGGSGGSVLLSVVILRGPTEPGVALFLAVGQCCCQWVLVMWVWVVRHCCLEVR